jgi:hypothetical protein
MVRRALLALVVVGCSACAAVLGFERLSEEGRIEDAGPDVSTIDAGEDAEDPACSVVGVPDRPDASTTDGGSSYVFAVSTFDLGIDPTRGAAGYNLDRACSTSIATSSCATSADPTTFDEYVRDKDRGVDNAGFALLQFVAGINDETFGPRAIDERLRRGQFGLAMRLGGWSETDDDDDVRLELFPALRVVNGADGGASPSFTAADSWTRDERFRVASDATRFISVRAWVRARTLVAFFADVAVPITITGDDKRFDIVLREAWLTARIQGSGGSAHLAGGVLAARWKTSEFLAEVRLIKAGGYTVCESPARELLYEPAKSKICAGRDIAAGAAGDGTGAPCAAISVGARFETYAVEALGPFVAEPAFSARCNDGGVPLGDDCP